MRNIRLFLDNIRSVHNVGSIFRTAETAAISKIYCVGTTPQPNDRFGRKRTDVAKVALGAEEIVPWQYCSDEDGLDMLKKLKKEGFEIIALEQDKKSVDYKTITLGTDAKAMVILGNEVEGVSKRLLSIADTIGEIPLQGTKESLNVSVATGIFLYRILGL